MTLNDWLEESAGRVTAMAAHFEVTPSAVSQWKRNGVPPGHMKAVCEFTDGVVTLGELLQALVEVRTVA